MRWEHQSTQHQQSTYLTGITGFAAFIFNPGIVVDGGGITNVSKIIVVLFYKLKLYKSVTRFL